MLSIIVTTYNWPQALELVLKALAAQATQTMEIIIADDGSGVETKEVIEASKKIFNCKLSHIWQPDEGFQAAKIRNKAIAHAEGEYILFIDGDCIIAKDYIQNQLTLRQKNYFVAGNRLLLTPEFTAKIVSEKQNFHLHEWNVLKWIFAKQKKQINRLLPCIKLKFFSKIIGLFSKNKWQGVKTCNLGVWKKDLVEVNGFDESFTGWGFEDSDLVVRLLRKGVKRKEARFYAPVIHLWHKEQPRDKEQENFKKLEKVIKSNCIFCQCGLNQYAI